VKSARERAWLSAQAAAQLSWDGPNSLLGGPPWAAHVVRSAAVSTVTLLAG
jgi:hypothetical protein